MGGRSAEELLKPYVAGAAREDGEQDMRCPLHHDSRRSATVNFERGVWWCGAGCGGGSIKDLVSRHDEWLPPADGTQPVRRKGVQELPTERQITSMSNLLLKDETIHGILVGERGITRDTAARYQIGWDSTQRAFSIPVRDADGKLVNVRYYDPNPDRTRRKMWQVQGQQSKMLYPLATLADDPDHVVICEGEWDTLLTLQHGFPAITRTGSAGTWFAAWNPLFKGKLIYLAHDCDDAGAAGNAKVGRELAKWASEVRVVELPFPHTDKHGKDLSDYWLEGHSADEFQRLLQDAPPYDSERLTPEVMDPHDASVLDSFDSRKLGKPLRLTVTVQGKRDPGYSVPREARLTCDRAAGEKCQRCPLAATGDDVVEVELDDPVILELMNSTKNQVLDLLRQQYGAQKCTHLTVEPTEHQAVEVLFARPSVAHMNGSQEGVHKTMKINSVGRHDTLANNTVQVVGALHPDPRSQLNEFLAWNVARLETSIDSFEPTAEDIRLMKRFRPEPGQRPLKKLGEIADELAQHVTKIYGRKEMHALMDLVWHSVLQFRFDGELLQRGWLEGLIVGDTRTGKSEVAKRLAAHYGAGEIADCENATLAGLVGGLQQFGSSSREWAITWGVIPLNDRRLVVLDEISGLAPEAISSMSQMRSSGIAELNKIQQDRTMARTRLLWMGNPRGAKMRNFTYGVDAIPPLIGNNEDVARFDLAMSVAAGEIPTEVINRSYTRGELTYTEAACRALVRWVWSRTSEQVEWAPGAVQACYRAAQEVGSRYVDDPPLVLPADIRVKIARIATAIAARLFSSSRDHESIVVKPEHVKAAVGLLDTLYRMPGFGYAERSEETIGDAKEARQHADDIRDWLGTHPGLAKFLRSNSSFRTQDLESILKVQRETANAIVNQLWTARMIHKVNANVVVNPALHDILRRVK